MVRLGTLKSNMKSMIKALNNDREHHGLETLKEGTIKHYFCNEPFLRAKQFWLFELSYADFISDEDCAGAASNSLTSCPIPLAKLVACNVIGAFEQIKNIEIGSYTDVYGKYKFTGLTKLSDNAYYFAASVVEYDDDDDLEASGADMDGVMHHGGDTMVLEFVIYEVTDDKPPFEILEELV